MTSLEQTAMQLAYIVKEYKEYKLPDLLRVMSVPAIDFNCAIWYAVNKGWINEPDKTTGFTEFKNDPEAWDFGDEINRLKDLVVFGLTETNKREIDMQWEHLSDWVLGYPPRYTLIVFKSLLAEEKIAMYQLTDPKDTKSVYDFYTLPENRDKLWGKKAFKVQPTGETAPGEINGGAETATESEE